MAERDQRSVGIARVEREVALALHRMPVLREMRAPAVAITTVDGEGHAMPAERIVAPLRAGRALDREEGVAAELHPDRARCSVRVVEPCPHREPEHAGVEDL